MYLIIELMPWLYSSRLDAAFLNKYRSNPANIAAWKAASRVERAPRKSDAPPVEPAP